MSMQEGSDRAAPGAGPVPSGGTAPAAGAVARKAGRKAPASIEGVVTSAKMNKTITVETVSLEMDPRYKKYVRCKVRFKAHDEDGAAGEGDVVRIVRTRPISLTKRWRLVQVVSKAKH
jgi:small subunit ribosomal protein S17